MEQQHYDVFISFKNTAADGTQSIDAQLASEIYKNLTERGISAFYSNVKLLELGEATYKKAIEDALDQSSILVCILSCKEYATSKWVEYERESFHEDILAGRNPNGVIVPYLGNLQGNDIPRSIRNYESFMMGAHTPADVCEFVANIINKRRASEPKSLSGKNFSHNGQDHLSILPRVRQGSSPSKNPSARNSQCRYARYSILFGTTQQEQNPHFGCRLCLWLCNKGPLCRYPQLHCFGR